ncbi:Uncharacterised protein [Halioglobus japonicus]|nr:Uncharacterised protein [Halioglobus japonicus]
MYHRNQVITVRSSGAATAFDAGVAVIAAVFIAMCLGLYPPFAHSTDDARYIDVGIVVFNPGIPADASTHSKLGIFPEIRKAEAKYMPVVLRQTLIDTGDWGVVRVLPEALDSSELLVTGTIIHSDGQWLELRIVAKDAAGAIWLDRAYNGTTTSASYPVKIDSDPYIGVYQRIASDLLDVRRQMSAKQLADLREIALMRYAAGLAPEVFASYLASTPEGAYSLVRLPAEDDPMLARVVRIRNQEYLFIDTVDEQYARLAEAMAPTYNLWRQYSAEQAQYRDDYEARVASRSSQGRRGSFVALEQTYNAYKWSKIHEQDLDELALGFNNEVAPTVMEVSGTVFKLSGGLDSQYTEWRGILQRIFALETGLPPAA